MQILPAAQRNWLLALKWTQFLTISRENHHPIETFILILVLEYFKINQSFSSFGQQAKGGDHQSIGK